MTSIWEAEIEGGKLTLPGGLPDLLGMIPKSFHESAPNAEKALKVLPYTEKNAAAVHSFLEAVRDNKIRSGDKDPKKSDGRPALEEVFGDDTTFKRLIILANKDEDAFIDILSQAKNNALGFKASIDAHYEHDYPKAAKTKTPSPPGPDATPKKEGTPNASSTNPPPNQPPPPPFEAAADPAAALTAADTKPKTDPSSPPKDKQSDDLDLGKLIQGLLKALEFLIKTNILGLGSFAKWIKDEITSPEAKGLMEALGVDPKVLDTFSDHHAPPPNAVPVSNDLAKNANRTWVMGHFINPEEAAKVDGLTVDGKPDGKKIVEYKKQDNGLYSITLHQQDGQTEFWQQTYKAIDGKTGASLLAFERRNADGTVFVDQGTGKPQVILEKVGSLGTEQDLANMKKIVGGEAVPELMEATAAQTRAWVKYEQEVLATRRMKGINSEMPDITLAGHSMGNYSIGAVTQTLAENHIAPQQTIETAPVGAGAGLRYLATANNATPEQAEARANLLAKNVVTFQPVGTVFSSPGGAYTHDNSPVGQVISYGFDGLSVAGSTSGANPADMITAGHKLVAPVQDYYQYGAKAFLQTPELNTPASTFVHDTKLDADKQQEAQQGFSIYENMMRSGKTPVNAQSASITTPLASDQPQVAGSETPTSTATKQTAFNVIPGTANRNYYGGLTGTTSSFLLNNSTTLTPAAVSDQPGGDVPTNTDQVASSKPPSGAPKIGAPKTTQKFDLAGLYG